MMPVAEAAPAVGTAEADLLRRLDAVYASFDSAVAEAVGRSPALACPAGCAACCRTIGVQATPVEALRVARAVAALDAAAQSALLDRARSAARLLNGGALGGAAACPCLEAGRCLVYEDRPLVCRAWGQAAEVDGRYVGCAVLGPAVERERPRLANFTRARVAVRSINRRAEILDSAGAPLPPRAPLTVLLDRLFPAA